MTFKIEPEFVDGREFKIIDKGVKSAYSRITEITLKIDPDGWILCWELARKRFKKVTYSRWFVFVDAIVDVRINRLNQHEMIVVCARNYTSTKSYTFVSEQDVVKRWSDYLFRLAYWHKNKNEQSVNIVNQLIAPLRLDLSKKFHTEIDYENFTQMYDDITEKIVKHEKSNLLNINEDSVDTYLRFISRPDLEDIFNQIAKGKSKINADQFQDFINSVQYNYQSNITHSQTIKLIHQLEPKEKELSLKGFIKFMTGPLNDDYGVVNYDGSNDKDRPLSHYYIKSSHNTYLNGAQICAITNIPSTKHRICMADVEMYRQVLLGGCRCIEIDCWDGPQGTPVVTHGPIALQRINTLPLEEVCGVIMECAFKVSCYPLVLSLENHCGQVQQGVMVQYFKEIFGHHLLSYPIDGFPLNENSSLPPPEALLYKILLKGTCRRNQKNMEIKSKMSIPNPFALLKQLERSNVDTKKEQFREEVVEDDIPIQGRFDKLFKNKAPPLPTFQQNSTDDDFDSDSISTVEMSSTLADLINYFQSSHELNFDDPNYIMHSSSEYKIDKTLELYGNTFLQHSARHMIRVYPAAWRVDSSNFNPIQYLIAGCQMVSINFQTSGVPMQLYDAFFDQNYNSGYVAKPKILCEQPDKNREFSAYKLEIQVISAQFLNLITTKCRKQLGKVRLKLDLYDLPHSLCVNQWEIESERSSKGFNTLFKNNTIVFDNIITPEIAMLHIRIIEEWGNNKIGQRFLHVNGIKQGYRHITLKNKDNRPEPACIFVKFRLQKYVPEHQPSIRQFYLDPIKNRLQSDEARKSFKGRLDAWEKQKNWAAQHNSDNKASQINETTTNSLFPFDQNSVRKQSTASLSQFYDSEEI